MNLWVELHTHALDVVEDDRIFLGDFRLRIPRYENCHCREFWDKYFMKNPPKYGHNGEYFKWTVEAHNAVNAKLGKKQITVEEAYALFKKS